MGIFGWSLPPGCGSLPDEESGAYEVEVDGVWYALDDADVVHKYDPNNPGANEDGFIRLGQLVWPDLPTESVMFMSNIPVDADLVRKIIRHCPRGE